jgi:DNA-binding FadR family transcriptional regulator
MDDMSSAAQTAGPVQRSLAHFFHSRIADAICAGSAKEAGVWMDAHLAQLESDFRHSRDVR